MAETLGSTLTGAALSVGLAIVMTTTPVGWGLALVLAAGSAIAGYSGGIAARAAYTNWGADMDLVGKSRVDRLCN